jgi:hypothetical protein
MADVMNHMDEGFFLPKEFKPMCRKLSNYKKNTLQLIPQNQQTYGFSVPAQIMMPQAVVDFRTFIEYFAAVSQVSGTQTVGSNEVWTLTTTTTPTAGTYQIEITIFGVSAIAGPFLFNAIGSTVQTALNALPNVLPYVTATNPIPIAVTPLATPFLVTAQGSTIIFQQNLASTIINVGGNNSVVFIDNGLTAAAATAVTMVVALTPAVSQSSSCLPKNIESLIDRYEITLGGQNLHQGTNQYNTLFNNYLAQNTSTEFQRFRSVLQNAGGITLLNNAQNVVKFGATNGSAANVPQTFAVSQHIGFLGNKCILDLRKMPQMIIKIFWANPLICPVGISTDVASYFINNFYADIDVLDMPKEYDEIMDSRMSTYEGEHGGIEIPYFNWYQTETSAASPAVLTTNFRFSFETKCMNDLIAIVRSPTYQAQAALDATYNQSTYFKQQSMGLGSYVWNVFGANYPQYFIPINYGYIQLQKTLNKLNHVDCGIFYNSLTDYKTFFFALHQSFHHLGEDAGTLSGMDTRGKTSQMLFNAFADGVTTGAGYTITVFICCTSVLRLGHGNQYSIQF